MKILQRYLLGQVILTMLLTACVFTFVLLIWTVLKELLPLLVTRNLGFGIFGQALLLLVPFLWVFAMPMGMLTATLLVFGRFSADQELTAARASGVSLMSLVLPIVLLSLLLCGVSAYVNMQLAPASRVAYNTLRHEFKPSMVNLPERRAIKDIPGHVIHIGRNRNGSLEDILVFEYENETNLQKVIEAKRGELIPDPTNQTLVLQLHDATGLYFNESGPAFLGNLGGGKYVFDVKATQKARKGSDISDMTITELRRELRELETRISLPLAVPKEETQKQRVLKRKPSDITEPYRVHMHRQVAFSFACFGFTLVGIPLGIRMHRRETNVGIAIALGLVLVYYSMIILAQALSTRSELAPHLLMWVPNFLFQAVGAVLLWRANRGL